MTIIEPEEKMIYLIEFPLRKGVDGLTPQRVRRWKRNGGENILRHPIHTFIHIYVSLSCAWDTSVTWDLVLFYTVQRFPRARDFHHDLMRRENIMRVCRDKGGFSFSRAHMPRETESGGADRARDACESMHSGQPQAPPQRFRRLWRRWFHPRRWEFCVTSLLRRHYESLHQKRSSIQAEPHSSYIRAQNAILMRKAGEKKDALEEIPKRRVCSI